jgi:hypothetical protein
MYVFFPRIPEVPILDLVRVCAIVVSPAVALISALFVVTAYELEGGDLLVQRLFWRTRLSLGGLTQAGFDPAAMQRSLRLFGNGGLFSISGLFSNRTLGRYRAFVTDPRHAVVLRLRDRVLVLSPANPGAFLDALAQHHPSTLTRSRIGY